MQNEWNICTYKIQKDNSKFFSDNITFLSQKRPYDIKIFKEKYWEWIDYFQKMEIEFSPNLFTQNMDLCTFFPKKNWEIFHFSKGNGGKQIEYSRIK